MTLRRIALIARVVGMVILVPMAGALVFRAAAEAFRAECDPPPFIAGVGATGSAGVAGSASGCACSPQKAFYFAATAVTTVGFGSGLELKTPEMQLVAAVFSLIGAGTYALLFGLLVWWFQQYFDRHWKATAKP